MLEDFAPFLIWSINRTESQIIQKSKTCFFLLIKVLLMLSYFFYNSVILTWCILKGINLIYMVDQTNKMVWTGNESQTGLIKAKNCSRKIYFMTKLNIYIWSCSIFAQLLMAMHILKEKIFTYKQKYTKNNAKFSAPHLTFNQILILFKSYQWVKL